MTRVVVRVVVGWRQSRSETQLSYRHLGGAMDITYIKLFSANFSIAEWYLKSYLLKIYTVIWYSRRNEVARV